jgi:hypothetical protein
MKAVSPLVGFVLTIFMTIMVTTLTFTVIKPALERNRGFNIINEASVNLELLSSAINEVSTEAEGSKRTVSLSVSDGEYLIDKNSNNIIFTFEPSVDLGVIGRIGDKFLEKGLAFFDFFNNYLDNSLPKNLINISGSWRIFNNRLEGINGTAYYFIDKNLNGFYVASNFGSDNNLGQIFVSPVNLSGLVLYLTFDEGSGNIVYDYSGDGNNGTLYNGTSICGGIDACPLWVDGKFGKALSFDGVDDYISISAGPSLDITRTMSVTVAFWFNMPDTSLSRNVMVKDGELAICVGGGYLIFRDNRANGYSVSASLENNKWYFFVGEYDYSVNKVKIYLNGNLIASGLSGAWNSSPTTRIFTIGSGNYPNTACSGRFYQGFIDEVLIFNRTLSEEEIRFLYQEGLKKLQNSGMMQFNSQIKPFIAISNPSGKIYVENLRVGNQNSKEIKLIKPFYGLELDSNFRFSKGNHQIKIENIGFNSTSKRPIIRISES